MRLARRCGGGPVNRTTAPQAPAPTHVTLASLLPVAVLTLARRRDAAGAVQQVKADGTAVQFDFNHPLAGQPVTFEVQLIGVM